MSEPLKYSEQAEALISAMKDFDRADFERWYQENVIRVVGGSFITAYVCEKYSQKKHNSEGEK